jgi:hypothetical protein
VLATTARTRPSTDVAVPHDVTDVMLWRLAFDVAVEHQRGPDGSCTNLRCAGQHGPCKPAMQAQGALRAARRPATPAPQPPAAPPNPAAHAPVADPHQTPAVGRATVIHADTRRFTGWFANTAAAADQWRVSDPPRRTLPAALAAA